MQWFERNQNLNNYSANKNSNYIELPYVVKGMDLSFSGIVSAALRIWRDSDKSEEFKEDLCFSLQETAFAMITEVTERALSHTKKTELILTGGVAASERLTEMLEIMCKARGVKFYPCPREYAGDNGVMIAYNGLQIFNFERLLNKNSSAKLSYDKADFNQNWRTDEVDVSWM